MWQRGFRMMNIYQADCISTDLKEKNIVCCINIIILSVFIIHFSYRLGKRHLSQTSTTLSRLSSLQKLHGHVRHHDHCHYIFCVP